MLPFFKKGYFMSQVHWQVGITLEEVEKQVILAALQYFQQNRTKAADALGISTRTIQNKLNQYNGVKEEPETISDEPKTVYSENDKLNISSRKRK